MSWIDQVNTDLVIQTGDGKQFTPGWVNAKVVVEYNTAQFNFPGVKGTLVNRREQKGSKFNLEIHFQGENHLDEMKEFVESAADPRFWTISHPFYDLLTVQPLSLDINNENYNISKITIPIIQTITDVHPKVIIIIEDKVEEDAEIINEGNSVNFATNVEPSSRDKNEMLTLTDSFFANAQPNILNNSDGEELFNKYNDTKSKILNSTLNPFEAMVAILDFIEFIANLDQNLISRLNMLKRNLDSLRNNMIDSFQDLANMPNSLKHTFEYMGSGLISTLSLASVNPFDDDDYANRTQVSTSIDCISDSYNQFLEDLDTMQVGSGGDPNDYVAASETINLLNDLVNFTMANLFDLALEAKQERFLTLEDDSDFITLTHRLYGLDEDDVNLNRLISNNDLGLNGILNIVKGTKITYYI